LQGRARHDVAAAERRHEGGDALRRAFPGLDDHDLLGAYSLQQKGRCCLGIDLFRRARAEDKIGRIGDGDRVAGGGRQHGPGQRPQLVEDSQRHRRIIRPQDGQHVALGQRLQAGAHFVRRGHRHGEQLKGVDATVRAEQPARAVDLGDGHLRTASGRAIRRIQQSHPQDRRLLGRRQHPRRQHACHPQHQPQPINHRA